MPRELNGADGDVEKKNLNLGLVRGDNRRMNILLHISVFSASMGLSLRVRYRTYINTARIVETLSEKGNLRWSYIISQMFKKFIFSTS
jgi:hypothetical protein